MESNHYSVCGANRYISTLWCIYRTVKKYFSLRFRQGVPAEILKNAGEGFICGTGSLFRRNEKIIIGANVYMGNFVHISAPCIIGNDVLLASRVAFVGGDHRFDIPGVLMNASGRDVMKPIIVEDDTWIGHGSIVLTGITIHRGSIVAAGSLVNKDIPPCTIYGGVPARYIRERFSTEHAKDAHLLFLETRCRKDVS